MKNLTIVALSLLLVSTVLFMAFKPAPAPAQANDHVVIYWVSGISNLFVSKNGSEYEKVSIKTGDTKGVHNRNSCISLIKQYETEGYEIKSINGNKESGRTSTEVWMIRKK